jgi:hypothetical protein
VPKMTVPEVLAWLEERAENSTSTGSHCHAYEAAARKLKEALSTERTEDGNDQSLP